MPDYTPLTAAADALIADAVAAQKATDAVAFAADESAAAAALAAVTQQRDAALTEVKRLRDKYEPVVVPPAPDPAPTPAPAGVTQIGACPPSGSATTAVITKLGAGASVRGYRTGGFGAAVERPATASIVHWSWKPAIGSTITDAMLVTAFVNLKDGDIVEVWHEADVKYRKGSALAPMLDMKNAFHAAVVRLRDAGRIAQVRTCNTWAGWSVDSSSGVNANELHCDADLLGIDMDGIAIKSDAYYPFAARQLAETAAAFKAGGYSGWCVPEFNASRYTATDPSGAKRIAWFTAEVAKIRQGLQSAGLPAPICISYFDYSGVDPNAGLNTAEAAAWKALKPTA